MCHIRNDRWSVDMLSPYIASRRVTMPLVSVIRRLFQYIQICNDVKILQLDQSILVRSKVLVKPMKRKTIKLWVLLKHRTIKQNYVCYELIEKKSKGFDISAIKGSSLEIGFLPSFSVVDIGGSFNLKRGIENWLDAFIETGVDKQLYSFTSSITPVTSN